MMKFFFKKHVFVVFSIIAVFAACKPQQGATTAADKAFNSAKYFTAVELYKKASGKVKGREEKQQLNFKVAESYRFMNNSKQAEIWYDKAIQGGLDTPEANLYLANAYLTNEKNDLALEQFQEYVRKKPGDEAGKRGLESVRNAIEWEKKPTSFEVFPETTLNTKEADFSPTLYDKGLIFTSTREPVKGKNLYEWTGKGFLNLYNIQKGTSNRWGKAALLSKDVSTKFNEGVSSYDANTSTLYYTQCNGNKGKELECKIYSTTFDGAAWSAPELVKIDGTDSTATFGHPSITADGNTLYFSSTIPGGYGGKDIYKATKSGSAFSNVENLGSSINSAGDDVFPFIHKSGTLYFSSNGREGAGGLDIYFSDVEEGEFEDANNLKFPMNSTADDFGLILDENKEEGYFSSNRVGGKGDDDIYSATAIPFIYNVEGKAFHAATNKVLPDTKVTLRGSDGTEISTITDAKGYYKMKLNKRTSYELNAQKSKFFGDVGSLTTDGLKESKDFTVDFKLAPIPVIIVLKGIFYDLNKADLRAESMVTLDTLVKTLNDNPNITIELSSHTDSRADSAYNLELSQRRAQSVVDYVISKSIEKERLTAKGYGESRLVNECKDGVECTEEQHQANRRTEFTVLSEDYVAKEKPKVLEQKVAPKKRTIIAPPKPKLNPPAPEQPKIMVMPPGARPGDKPVIQTMPPGAVPPVKMDTTRKK